MELDLPSNNCEMFVVTVEETLLSLILIGTSNFVSVRKVGMWEDCREETLFWQKTKTFVPNFIFCCHLFIWNYLINVIKFSNTKELRGVLPYLQFTLHQKF